MLSFWNAQIKAQHDPQTSESRYIELLEEIEKQKKDKDLKKVEASYVELIKLAKTNNWEWRYFNSSISLAEFYRFSADFENGLITLRSLKGIEKYPDLEIRMLGRMAAIHSENYVLDIASQVDSVIFYVDSAYQKAINLGIYDQLSSLQRDYGAILIKKGQVTEGLDFLYSAAQSFLEEGDIENHSGTLVNILQHYTNEEKINSADSLAKYLWNLSKDKDWVSTKSMIAGHRSIIAELKGDSIGFYKWQMEELKWLIERQNETKFTNTEEYKILHERNEYRSSVERSKLKAREKAIALKEEAARKKQVTNYLIAVLVVLALIVFLYVRERGIKEEIRKINLQLKEANNAYQLVVIESNHRIKNNLQMIISLIRFSMKDKGGIIKNEMEEVSNQIHTIGSLHQLLTMKDHKEKSDVERYFREIIDHYSSLNLLNNSLSVDIEKLQMNSERLVYFGLILNELLSNTVKYSKQIAKPIEIAVTSSGKGFYFSYKDYSPHEQSVDSGTGTLLVKQLVKKLRAQNFIFEPKTGSYSFYFEV